MCQFRRFKTVLSTSTVVETIRRFTIKSGLSKQINKKRESLYFGWVWSFTPQKVDTFDYRNITGKQSAKTCFHGAFKRSKSGTSIIPSFSSRYDSSISITTVTTFRTHYCGHDSQIYKCGYNRTSNWFWEINPPLVSSGQ
jgi:hypothetical protein